MLVVDENLFNESAAQEQVRLLIARGSISKHALLTQFKQVDAIAKTSVGKIDKKALRVEHILAS